MSDHASRGSLATSRGSRPMSAAISR
jgi:hypothetical protein